MDLAVLNEKLQALSRGHGADVVTNMLDRYQYWLRANEGEPLQVLPGGVNGLVVLTNTTSWERPVVCKVFPLTGPLVRAEADFLEVSTPTGTVLNVNEPYGLIVMEYLKGETLSCKEPYTDTTTVHRVIEIVNETRKLIVPQGLPTISDVASTCSRIALRVRNAGDHKLADTITHVISNIPTGNEWCAFDLHPKNVIVNSEGDWSFIDPWPVTGCSEAAYAKWVVAANGRTNPVDTLVSEWVAAFVDAGIEPQVFADWVPLFTAWQLNGYSTDTIMAGETAWMRAVLCTGAIPGL